jgi:hypothetical protein
MAFAAEYMRDIELEMLAPNGSVIEKWTLKNAWVSSADFGELDMSVSDLADVTIELRYDYGILHTITGAQ